MKYNLDVLNDKEFEDLCKDLFDGHYAVDFQTFKAGRDGGIDLVFSDQVENEIVVQCKHYMNSTFALLIGKLRDTELANIKKMSPIPMRYVVATTLPLSPLQTTEIKSVLSPYIRITNDIFGRKRIENLISKNPSIEKKFFKLWLTSTNVMVHILHHASNYTSEFYRAKIIANARLYVPTQNLNKALEKLSEHKFLIISGAPGVGKTTLAFMLICERLAQQYDLVYCEGRIAEVEHALSEDPAKKQIFFIDDFLGANLYDIRNPKNPENKLISFIQKFQSAKNKLLVLTSRTTVLNQARYDYEHLKNSGLTTISRYELKLQQYAMLDKAKILYNHLFFSKLNQEFTDAFFSKEVYAGIIQHRNYFPRLIQFITDQSKFQGSGFTTVKDFIFFKLEHPDEIWEYAFEKQLDDEDRLLLLCLFTLGGNQIPESQLLTAFEHRYRYEIKQNNLRRIPKAYQNSLKKVLNGFVNATQDVKTGENLYTFFNPSIIDFLLGYFKNNDTEINFTLNSIYYIEQLTMYFDVNANGKILIRPKVANQLFLSVIENIENLESIRSGCCLPLEILDILQHYFEESMKAHQNIAVELLAQITEDASAISSGKLGFLLWKIGEHEEWPEAIESIRTEFHTLVMGIIRTAEIEDDFDHFMDLFKLYKQDFNAFMEMDDFRWALQESLGSVFTEMINDIDHDDNYILEYIDEYGESSAETNIREKVWDIYVEFVNRASLGDYFDSMDHEYELDPTGIIGNIRDRYSSEWDDRDFKPRIAPELKTPEDPWVEIDRLFTKK